MTPFDLDRLQRETFVQRIEYFDEASSTNTLAAAMAERDEVPLPLLVLAGRQTAGRGRGANRWWSSEGALTFSLVLEAEPTRLPAARRPLVSLAAGLAVCEALYGFLSGHEVGVKWPNDVHLNGKKACGILVESIGCGERLVIGVGINVNNPLAEAPEEIASRAVSLVDVTGAALSLTDVLGETLRQLAKQWDILLSANGQLIERLRRRCVLTGRWVTIDVGAERIVGLCRGLADDGALLIETPVGERAIYAGVVAAIDN